MRFLKHGLVLLAVFNPQTQLLESHHQTQNPADFTSAAFHGSLTVSSIQCLSHYHLSFTEYSHFNTAFIFIYLHHKRSNTRYRQDKANTERSDFYAD